jgi:hypothetical protein
MAAPQFNQASIRTRVRRRADMENSTFVSDVEIDQYTEAAFQELYGMAVSEWEDIYIAQVDFAVTSASDQLNLGAMKKLRALRIKNDRFLSPVSLREIESLDSSGGASRRGRPRLYWLRGVITTNLGMSAQLIPPPDGNYTITAYIVPATSLVDVAAIVNSMPPMAGWDEYIVITGAIKCKDKEESDVSVLLQERGMLLENIRKTWQPVDTSEAARVVQLGERRSMFSPYDYIGDEDYFG